MLQGKTMRAKDIISEAYSAYVLSEESRNQLAELFPPKYPKFIGHHITHEFGIPSNSTPPEFNEDIEVVGYLDDIGRELEVLVVNVSGSHIRPDGKIYHITWSLNPEKGTKPVHSNNALAENGFTKIAMTATIKAPPAVLK